MPIYEYECKACGPFEVLQKMSDPPLKKCEKCGKSVHRLVSLSSFALVGGGWYKDLYSSTNKGATSASAESKTESKPAKTETKSEKTTSAAA